MSIGEPVYTIPPDTIVHDEFMVLGGRDSLDAS
jgi:hypothetical protein